MLLGPSNIRIFLTTNSREWIRANQTAGSVDRGFHPDSDSSVPTYPLLSLHRFFRIFPICLGLFPILFFSYNFMGLLNGPTRNIPESVRPGTQTGPFPEKKGSPVVWETHGLTFSQRPRDDNQNKICDFERGGIGSRGTKRDKLNGTNRAEFAVFRRFSLIFADFRFSLGITALQKIFAENRRKPQIFTENRRKPLIFAENRRKPQIFAETRLSHLVCPF